MYFMAILTMQNSLKLKTVSSDQPQFIFAV